MKRILIALAVLAFLAVPAMATPPSSAGRDVKVTVLQFGAFSSPSSWDVTIQNAGGASTGQNATYACNYPAKIDVSLAMLPLAATLVPGGTWTAYFGFTPGVTQWLVPAGGGTTLVVVAVDNVGVTALPVALTKVGTLTFTIAPQP